jgi:ADP-heptose:LPS heptosyltransferase
VVITGTAQDEPYLAPLRKQLSQSSSDLLWLDGKLSPQELLFILSKARLVVAPSTGVLHLAASLGTPCVGLYADEPAFHPKRWGPFVDENFKPKIKILVSSQKKRKNPKELDDLSVVQVWTAAHELLSHHD